MNINMRWISVKEGLLVTKLIEEKGVYKGMMYGTEVCLIYGCLVDFSNNDIEFDAPPNLHIAKVRMAFGMNKDELDEEISKGMGWVSMDHFKEYRAVTHWMPLPEAPKTESEVVEGLKETIYKQSALIDRQSDTIFKLSGKNEKLYGKLMEAQDQ